MSARRSLRRCQRRARCSVAAGVARPAAERRPTLRPIQPANKGRARTNPGVNSPRGKTGAACRCRRTLVERRLGVANAGMGKPRRRRSAELNARCQRRRLTFELRGRNRNGAWPARRSIDRQRLAGQVPGRWRSLLERRVSRHSSCATRTHWWLKPRDGSQREAGCSWVCDCCELPQEARLA
jgi:hypothetical protein